MKSWGRTTKLGRLLWSLVVAGVMFLPAVSRANPDAQPGYVALGDSIEFGVGATGQNGYVPRFHAHLQSILASVALHNLSEPGATTRDINLEQLPPALAEIQNHRPYGVVVSWGGGGNNLLQFIQSPQAASCMQIPSCLARINALLTELQQNVDLALKALRFFAGPESPILVRTQYNPLLKTGCDPDGRADLASAAFEGAPGTLLDEGLNDRLRTLAAKHGAKAVEIFVPFFMDPDGLISDDCIHPNDAGYQAILSAFIDAFDGP